MSEPVWIPLATLHLLHDRQIELFGGLRGIRDEGAIDSALARPVNAWSYGQADDLETLAAIYLCALARQQGYLDGNKRSALAAMLVFLKVNGQKLNAPGPELYAIVISAATNELGIEQVAVWIKLHVETLQEP
ncbi:MAG: type II toxin-antitoxin system death-on-curing family toxin [bacterium]